MTLLEHLNTLPPEDRDLMMFYFGARAAAQNPSFKWNINDFLVHFHMAFEYSKTITATLNPDVGERHTTRVIREIKAHMRTLEELKPAAEADEAFTEKVNQIEMSESLKGQLEGLFGNPKKEDDEGNVQ